MRSLGNSILSFMLIVLAAGAVTPAAGQEAFAGTRGEELRVYVMTMGPGQYVWERFGHNAIRIQDELRGTDIAYNYGMFSFDQEGFIIRFIRGHMDYWMQGFDAGLTATAYAADDRTVWLQELNLTPDQRADLRDFLEWNALPENRFYRYDYYLDNCSTRVRDAIDSVLGGQIRAQTSDRPSGTTFRDHTRILTADDPLVYAGLMVGLGQPVDREISVWEEMFLPLRMRDLLASITVVGASGAPEPLVIAEEVLYTSTMGGQVTSGAEVPTRTAGFLVVGLLLAAGVWGTSRLKGRAGRMAFVAFAGGWSFIAGVLGLVLAGLWLFTDHATSYRNENLFFISPVLLPLVILLPLAVRGRVDAIRGAYRIAAIAAGLSSIGFIAQILPMMDQANGEIIALALPVNLVLLLALRESMNEQQGTPPAARLRLARSERVPA